MKVLFICNLIPSKQGAFERLISCMGMEFSAADDELVAVFAGEPIPAVAAELHEAGVRWHLIEGWVGAGDAIHPWRFVFPALRLIRKEKPDLVVLNFGNELPALVASLLCRSMVWPSRVARGSQLLSCWVVRLLRGEWQLHSQKALPFSPTQQPNNSTTDFPARMRAPRWVWQQHQQIADPSRVASFLSRIRLLRLTFDQFVTQYEGGRRSLMLRGIPASRISVVFNGVPAISRRKPAGWLRAELSVPVTDNLPEREVLLVTIGSLIPRKRIDFILRACAALERAKDVGTSAWGGCFSGRSFLTKADPHPPSFVTVAKADEDIRPTHQCEAPPPTTEQLNNSTTGVPWRLLIIGEGPERERLAALAAELGIAGRVHFLGLRNDVGDILTESDLLLHASSAETCTYAITEAMAAGIPAVVTEAGAAREQVEDGVSGHVVGRDEFDRFVQRLSEVAASAELRRQMGQAARERWARLYQLDATVKLYHDLYRRISG